MLIKCVHPKVTQRGILSGNLCFDSPLLSPLRHFLEIRVFHKHTKLAMLALLPTLYSRRFAILSFKWNSIRLGGPAHGIVTKTVHKTLPGGGGGRGVGGSRGGGVGGGGSRGSGV